MKILTFFNICILTITLSACSAKQIHTNNIDKLEVKKIPQVVYNKERSDIVPNDIINTIKKQIKLAVINKEIDSIEYIIEDFYNESQEEYNPSASSSISPRYLFRLIIIIKNMQKEKLYSNNYAIPTFSFNINGDNRFDAFIVRSILDFES